MLHAALSTHHDAYRTQDSRLHASPCSLHPAWCMLPASLCTLHHSLMLNTACLSLYPAPCMLHASFCTLTLRNGCRILHASLCTRCNACCTLHSVPLHFVMGMLHAYLPQARCMLHAKCFTLHVPYTLRDGCHAASFNLYPVPCVLHAACITLYPICVLCTHPAWWMPCCKLQLLPYAMRDGGYAADFSLYPMPCVLCMLHTACFLFVPCRLHAEYTTLHARLQNRIE
jgi:hypothetical protein